MHAAKPRSATTERKTLTLVLSQREKEPSLGHGTRLHYWRFSDWRRIPLGEPSLVPVGISRSCTARSV